MTDKINCPFCGNLIEADTIRCKNCDSLFKEPELPNIKFKEIAPYIALYFLTFGLFGTLWFFINANAINNLTDNKKDSIKFGSLCCLLVLSIVLYFLFFNKLSFIFYYLITALYIALVYRVLKIIQKYTHITYNVTLEFNPYYVFFFNVFYLIHYIDTYSKRVNGMHEHFDWKSPQGILFIALLFLIICFGLFF